MIKNGKGSRQVAGACPGQQRGALRFDHGGKIICRRRCRAGDCPGDGRAGRIRQFPAFRDKMVDRTRRQRGACLQRTSMKHKLQGRLGAHPLAGAGRPPITRKKAQIDLRKTDLTHIVVNSDDAVEGQRQFQPTTDADAVDQDHRRAGKILDFAETVENLADMRLNGLSRLKAGELVDIGPEDEAARLARPEDKSLRWCRRQAIDNRKQFGHHGMRQHIRRPPLNVDRQPGDTVLVDHQLEMLIGCHVGLPHWPFWRGETVFAP